MCRVLEVLRRGWRAYRAACTHRHGGCTCDYCMDGRIW